MATSEWNVLPNCWCNSSPLLPLLGLIHKKPALPQQLQERGLDLCPHFPRQRENNWNKENCSDTTAQYASSWEVCCSVSWSSGLLPKQAEGWEGILQSCSAVALLILTPSMLLKEFPSAESHSLSFTSLSFSFIYFFLNQSCCFLGKMVAAPLFQDCQIGMK